MANYGLSFQIREMEIIVIPNSCGCCKYQGEQEGT